LHEKSEKVTMESWQNVIRCKPNANVSVAETAFKNVKAGYKNCRWEEETLEVNVVQCSVELEAIQSMMSSVQKMKEVKGELMVDKTACKAALGEDYESQLRRLANTWDDAYQTLAASQVDLGDHKKRLVEKQTKCANATKLHADKVKACKEVASQMDKAKCVVADLLGKDCAAYRQCFHKSKTNYELTVTTVKQTLKLIKKQLKALNRISCYVKGGDDSDKLENCGKRRSGHRIDLPPIQFGEPGDAYCYELREQPCNIAYVNVNYEGKAELCTPCVGIKGKISDY